MAEQIVLNWTDPNSVRKIIRVKAPQDIAWRVFTERMGTWWPLAMYKIGKANAVDAIIEPRVGGRWYERGEDGSTCDWGSVLAWEPNTRLVLSWDIDANFQYDPKLKTEIEVLFIAEGVGFTRVELEHRRLDRFGDRRAEMRNVFDKTGIGVSCWQHSRSRQSLRRDRNDAVLHRNCHAARRSFLFLHGDARCSGSW